MDFRGGGELSAELPCLRLSLLDHFGRLPLRLSDGLLVLLGSSRLQAQEDRSVRLRSRPQSESADEEADQVTTRNGTRRVFLPSMAGCVVGG